MAVALSQFRIKRQPVRDAGVRVKETQHEIISKAEFTVIMEKAPEGGFWAICPEVPGAKGQGETIEEAKSSLRETMELILVDFSKLLAKGDKEIESGKG